MVTAFNAIQYAADPVAAVKNMSQRDPAGRADQPAGLGAARTSARAASCSPSSARCCRPRPDDAPGAIAWSEDGQLEHLAAPAGLTPVAVTDVPNPLIYPDLATAVRTQLSSGPARAAIQHSGLPATRGALTRAFAGSRKPDGTYRQENVFRYLVART